MFFVDTHTHLYRESYPDNWEAVVGRALEAGVGKMILGCVNSETPAQINEAVAQYPDYFFALVGLHPEDTKENFEEELARLEPHIQDANIVGIGEIGLDYYWDRTFEKEQREVFYRQLCRARDLQLPLSLHIRSAYNDAIEILKKFRPGELTGVMHCFSGGVQEADWAVRNGFALGIGGTVTFKNSKVQDIVAHVGLDNVVLETDAPYLAPVPHRGKPNESSYIPIIAQKVADIFNVSLQTVADQTTENAYRIFTKLTR